MRMESKRPRLMPLEGEEFSHPIKNYPEDNDYELPHKGNLMARAPQNDKPFEFKLAPLRSISDSIPYYQQQHSPISPQVGSPLPSKVSHLVVPSGGNNGSSLSGQNGAVNSLVDLPEGYDITIMTQPVGYQIANYNIHPAPALTVNKPVNSNITIHAQLIENDRKSVIDGGFQSGDVRVLRAGHTTIYFTGLKLSKMGPIKTELHYRDYKRIPTTFRILFKIGNKQILTDPFKLVSSCAQLPQEVRDIVRPTKKMPKSGGSPDNSGSEDQPPPKSHHGSNNGLTLDAEMTQLRRELDNSIESADVEAAGQAAQRLAFLKKLQMAHLLLHQSPEPSPSLPLVGPPNYQNMHTKTS